MGIWNRDYMRNEPSMWSPVHWGPVKTILALCVIVFLGQIVFARSGVMEHYFGCSLQAVTAGLVWTPITYAFLHSVDSWLHIVVNMFLLWFFGRRVEEMLGAGRFWLLFVGAAAGGALAHISYQLATGSGNPVIGASAGVMAVVAMFALYNPRATLMLMGVVPMPAWVLVAILAAFDILGLFEIRQFGGSGIGHGAHLGGLAFSVGFWYLFVRRGFALPSLRLPRRRRRRRKRSSEGRLVDDQELDRILSKIHSQSDVDKLPTSEREFLNRASRRLRRRD